MDNKINLYGFVGVSIEGIELGTINAAVENGILPWADCSMQVQIFRFLLVNLEMVGNHTIT